MNSEEWSAGNALFPWYIHEKKGSDSIHTVQKQDAVISMAHLDEYIEDLPRRTGYINYLEVYN